MGLFKNWKPKKGIGKVLKGAVIGIGGAALVATGVGAVAGAVGGAGIFAGAAKGVGTLIRGVGKVAGGGKTVLSKVSAGGAKLLTGQSKEERNIIADIKKDAKDAKSKTDFVSKLMKLGLTEEQARAKAGLPSGKDSGVFETEGDDFLSRLRAKMLGDNDFTIPGTETPKKPITTNQMVFGGLGLAALLFLPKILKG